MTMLHAPHRKGRLVLVVLQALVAVSAIVGALALLARPDGSLLGLQPSWLIGFDSYTFPAMLLFAMGLVFVASTILVWRTGRAGLIASEFAGALLVIWIAVQAALVRPVNLLEIVVLFLGGAIFTIAGEIHRLESKENAPGGEPAHA